MAEIQRLRQEVEQLRRMVKRLQEAIARARMVCRQLIGQAYQEALSKTSGVPPGTWAFWKGVNHAACIIHAYLEVQG